MRFYHKLALVAVLSAYTPAWAQPAAPPVPPEQDVDDDEGYAQPAQPEDGMPPPDPRAYEQAPQYGYVGPHPIPYDVGSGYCYQQGPHFHEYPPFDQYLFRQSGGWFYFVGDPADFGYTLQMWGYRGNHPIPAAYGGGYCFIDWPHRHGYPPPPTLAFNFVGGYYVYAGAWDPMYWRWRPHYQRYYGDYYRRSYYHGAYWRVRPAPIYRPHVVVGAPGVYRPGAVVVAPGGVRVHVGPPRPYVRGPRVVAPGPRVVVPPPRVAPGPRVVVPPPRVAPAPRVYAPGPRVVAPGPRVVAPGPRVVAPGPRVVAPHPVGPGPRVVAPHPGPRPAPVRAGGFHHR